jgi:hypothetical protein
MKLYGRAFSLAQHQRWLRVSYVSWLVWIGLVVPICRMLLADKPVNIAWGFAGFAVLPALIMLLWVWPAKHGNMLILIGMILLLYLGFAVLAILKGGLSTVLFSIESLLLFVVLYWLMWVIERLPKLQGGKTSD